MTNSLKLSLLFVLLVTSVQAKQDPLADLKSCAKGMLPVAAGLCVGRVIGHQIGHCDAAAIAGGLLGAWADHYVGGGKQDPHYWWRKWGNVVPMAFAAEIIYFFRKLDRQAEQIVAKHDEIHADTKLLAKEEKGSLSVALVYQQLSYFVYKNEVPEVSKALKAKFSEEDPSLYKVDLLKHVADISNLQSDGSRIARIGNYNIILRGYGANAAYNLWKSLQENEQAVVPLGLPNNPTHYLSARLDAPEGDLPIADYTGLKEAVFAKWRQLPDGQDSASKFDQSHPEQTDESIAILAFHCDGIEWNTAHPAWAQVNIGNKRLIVQGNLARKLIGCCDRRHNQMVAEATKPIEYPFDNMQAASANKQDKQEAPRAQESKPLVGYVEFKEIIFALSVQEFRDCFDVAHPELTGEAMAMLIGGCSNIAYRSTDPVSAEITMQNGTRVVMEGRPVELLRKWQQENNINYDDID